MASSVDGGALADVDPTLGAIIGAILAFVSAMVGLYVRAEWVDKKSAALSERESVWAELRKTREERDAAVKALWNAEGRVRDAELLAHESQQDTERVRAEMLVWQKMAADTRRNRE